MPSKTSGQITESMPVRNLVIESLAEGIPAITQASVGFYKESCMVCFHNQSHKTGVKLRVSHNNSNQAFKIQWSGDVTDKLLKSYADLGRATEFAACAIALLLIRDTTEFTAIEQSVRGTTIDFYLGSKSEDDTLIFNQTAARLEVSGILRETETNSVNGRVNDKLRRLKLEGDLPDFIVVVEFSQPWSKMVQA